MVQQNPSLQRLEVMRNWVRPSSVTSLVAKGIDDPLRIY